MKQNRNEKENSVTTQNSATDIPPRTSGLSSTVAVRCERLQQDRAPAFSAAAHSALARADRRKRRSDHLSALLVFHDSNACKSIMLHLAT
eukprot:2935260-Pleurochrysis_carterae.AAC.2